MAIRINLLAEEQAAAEMRRKNPVKLGIWVGSFLVALVALWILKIQLDIQISSNKYKQTELAWKHDSTNYADVTNKMVRTSAMDRKLAALNRLSTNRFYWGPVLNSLQLTMVDGVEVTHLTGEQKFTKVEAVISGTGASKKRIPGYVTEKNSLTIVGKDLNPNSQNYNKFKEILGDYDFFVKKLGRPDGFKFDSVSTPKPDPLDPSKLSCDFSLTAQFKEESRGE